MNRPARPLATDVHTQTGNNEITDDYNINNNNNDDDDDNNDDNNE